MPLASSPAPRTNGANRTLGAVAAIVVIAAVLVIVFTQVLGPKKIIRTYSDGYKDGFTAARNTAYMLAPQLNQGARSSLSGQVLSVGSSGITFRVSGLITDQRVDGIGTDRGAKVTDQTVIVRLEALSSEDLARANAAFQAELRTFTPGEALPMPPSTTKEVPIKLSDIRVGDRVTVESVNKENVLPLGSFTVSKISVASPAAQ